ncbi:MAG: anaerobic ribonucleoside-triphosphate reductase activating protein [Firmicutes bacterium]|nr:anaerobic ribonucleoside-triphosphate reductase activating protein [Bacillota bacterium]
MGAELRISGIIRESIVDGPGMRFVVFCQGCPHRCEGCHNPQTHDFDGGNMCSTDKLIEEIKKDPLLKGVTFSGGEPFCQPEELCILADDILAMGLDIISYSGYTFEELLEMGTKNPKVTELLNKCDILIDGRFELEKRSLALPFRGSSNQRIIDVKESMKQGRAVEKELK